MPLSKGTKLGPLEILGPLGAGGMGEVYRALDTQLDREVAVKILPQAMARDPERLARFDREAKILAALNHPNIAVIHGMEKFEGGRALIMELVPGDTLGVRIKRGAMPTDEALQVAKQIAEALEAAHEKGVTHRDLKPGNVMITPTGLVKVLDFGLAAMSAPTQTSLDPDNSPTLTMGMTQAGAIMGTAAYMSPEQAAGLQVDRRADIWSYGVVLYEMLTGKRLFGGGESISHTLADVLRAPIDFDAISAGPVRKLLKRCLDRSLKTRLQSIAEARILIDEILTGVMPDESRTTATKSVLRPDRQIYWAVIALLAIAVAGLSWIQFRGSPSPLGTAKVSLLLPKNAKLLGQNLPAISPDGAHIAFTAALDGKTGLWVRDLDSLAPRAMPGTDGAQFPFWSPDSHSIGFFADGKLKRMDLAGGPALVLCDASVNARGGTWSQRGVIVFIPDRVTGAALYRVSDQGGKPTRILEADVSKGESGFRFPWFLPDGRHYLYLKRFQDNGASMIFVGDLDSDIHSPMIAATSNPVYAAGHLLFARERTLMAQPFDPDALKPTGEAVPIAEDVDYVQVDQRSHFSSSQNGVLTYVSGGVLGGVVQLTWLDRSGKPSGTVGKPGLSRSAAISPGDKLVMSDPTDQGTGFRDVWVHDLARGTNSRFTFGPTGNEFPIWSPDGGQVVYRSLRDRIGQLYLKPLSVAGEEALTKEKVDWRPTDWSKDGQHILLETTTATTGRDIWVLPMMGDKKPFPYLDSKASESQGELSPNGRWLAYTSDESKRNEVYVQMFPKKSRQWQVSVNGGSQPVWSRDGKELFFYSADGKLMAVEVREGPNNSGEFNASVPKPLFDVRIAFEYRYDVTKDGRFLFPIELGDQAGDVPLTVVLNWPAQLKK